MTGVVFDKRGPSPRGYRRFNIADITPGDDYAAMEQAILRYFNRLRQGSQDYPDLLVIDGGLGQVAVAARVLAQLEITEVTLLGIAKGPDRRAGFERLILSNRSHEITLAAESPALHLLQHIRDEAHRFAITSHRKKRQKSSFESSLKEIEGIGMKRHQALLQRFGGVRALSKASIEEIAKVHGISHDLATRIHAHFH